MVRARIMTEYAGCLHTHTHTHIERDSEKRDQAGMSQNGRANTSQTVIIIIMDRARKNLGRDRNQE